MINILPVIKQTPLITLFVLSMMLIIFIIAVLSGFLIGLAAPGPGI